MINTLYLVLIALALGSCRAEPMGLSPSTDGAQGADAAQKTGPLTCPDPDAKRVLVDAAHGGGVWWFPQHAVYEPSEWHQGQALANYLRSYGYEVDEHPRDQPPLSLLMEYPIVMRAGNYAPYTEGELEAYRRFLGCDVTLLLFGEYVRSGQTDALAEDLGLEFRGIVHDVVTIFEPHELTEGVGRIKYDAGSVLIGYDPERTLILGRLPDESPVMGLLDHPTARIFFTGDTNGLLPLPQPFTDNLVRWLQ